MDNTQSETSKSLKAVLWDMDGTLIDSEPLWQQVTVELGEYLGRALTPELLAQTQGATIRFTIELCAKHAGVELNAEKYQQLQQFVFDRMKYLLADVVTFPGVRELLAGLKNDGIACYVVTNTFRELAQPAIDAIGSDYFAGSICGDEVAQGKPDPLLYRTAAKNLGVAPADCLVFEDSQAGMIAAVTAGCKTIAVPSAVSSYPSGVMALPTSSFVGVESETLRNWFNTWVVPVEE